MSLPTLYSCSSASESDLASLVASGELSSVTISYRYEVDTSSSSVAAAVDRVQSTILAKVAEASGLGGCPVEAEGDRRRRRSLLRGGGRRILVAPWEGGRGSNSLVALSSSPPDAVAGVPCRSDVVASAASPRARDGDDDEEEEGAALEEVSRHASGGVVYGEELSEGSPDDAVELILSSTKVDGTVVARKSVPISPPAVVSEGGRDADGSNEDVLQDLALPFGFVSTQSLPKETNSHTESNPRVVPAAFQKSFPLRTMPEGTLERLPDSPNSPLSSTNIEPPPKPTRMAGGTCTVIQGRTTAYSASAVDDPFENLEGRILALVEHEIVHDSGSFQDDLVTDVRMYDAAPVDVPDPVRASPGYVTAIHAGLPDEEGSESAGAFDFTGPMAVLASLVCALIVLAALFAQTSRFRKNDEEGKRTRTMSPASWGTRSGQSGTARDEEVEVDASRSRKKPRRTEEARTEEEERRYAPHEPHRYSDDPAYQLERSADDNGNESFAWNPSNAEAAAAAVLSTLSFGSARREALAAADGRKDPEAARREAEATGAGEVLGDLRAAERERTPSRGQPGRSPRKSPRGSSRRIRSANAAGYERQETSGSAANDGRGGIQWSKSMGGWLDARPRAASPEESVELDVRSVYDCDADPAEGADGGKARGAGKALADPDDYVSGDAAGVDDFAADAGGPMPVITEIPTRTFPPGKKRSFLGKVFRGRSQQGKEEEEEERENLALDRMRRNLDRDHTPALADDVTADPRSRAATPVVTPGACQDLQCDIPMPPGFEPPALPVSSDNPMSSSLLQFFTARERRVTPHAEVEAGLCPFDDVSEYSASASGQDGGQEVESKFFFGNVSTKDDRILLTEDEHDEYKAYRRPKARMVRKFNKMLLQSRGACGAPGRTCDADVKEIHQIYSSDAADEKGSSIPHGGAKVASRRSRASSAGKSSRSRSRRRDEGAATPIYMMQRKPSCIDPLRPTGFYKSPSALSGKRRKRRGGGDDEGGGEEDHSPSRRGERGVFYAEGGDDEEDEGVPQYVTKTDEGEDGSVALYDPGVLCTGGLGDCWVPVWR